MSTFNKSLSQSISELGHGFSTVLAELYGGTLPKTLLFEGKDGASRRRAALLCASALLCEHSLEKGKSPCLECSACKKALSEHHADLTVLSCTDTKAVNVDRIREVRADAFVSPFEAEYKVFILDSADSLNVQSQNALLKILEEPPEKVYFILTAPSSRMLLETVSSRCAKYSLGIIDDDELCRSVCELAKGETEEKCRRICNAAAYLDGFELSVGGIASLSAALDLCDEFYASGKFPYRLIPAKKEKDEADTVKLIFKTLALCALELLEAKKGAFPEGRRGILSRDARDEAVMRLSGSTFLTHYELFCELYERLTENANYGAVVASLKAELGGF